jgi:predicted nucleotidyltransferase
MSGRVSRILKTLRRYKKYLQEKFKVQRIGIFGSYIKGKERKRSDLDVLVEFKEPIGLFKFMDLEEYLEKLIGIRVDLVSKRALKPRIGKYILKEVVYI